MHLIHSCLFLIICQCLVTAFTVKSRTTSLVFHRYFTDGRINSLSRTEDESFDTTEGTSTDMNMSNKVKRRRRKDDNMSSPVPTNSTSISSSSTLSIPTTQQPLSIPAKTMSVQVTDIRELVSGKKSESSSTMNTSENVDTVNRKTQESVSSSASSQFNNINPASSDTSNSNKKSNNDSLERLLADAKKMRQESKTDDISMQSGSSQSLNNQIVNTLSTIVTVDFFIVCGFLVWFLLGVVFSYAFHNDSVQIAFNGKTKIRLIFGGHNSI